MDKYIKSYLLYLAKIHYERMDEEHCPSTSELMGILENEYQSLLDIVTK